PSSRGRPTSTACRTDRRRSGTTTAASARKASSSGVCPSACSAPGTRTATWSARSSSATAVVSSTAAASTQPGTCCGKTRADRLPSADSSGTAIPVAQVRPDGALRRTSRLVPRTTREFLNNGFPAPQGAQAEKNNSSTPHTGLLLQPNTRDLSDKTKQEVCRHDDDSSATPRRHTAEHRGTHRGTVGEHQ